MNKHNRTEFMRLRNWSISCAAALFVSLSAIAAETVKYENNFDKGTVGEVPEEFLVLDGQFSIQEENGNKFLQLPGAPLDSYGVLFGPSFKTNCAVSARFFGTAKGRRFPTFAVGVNGVGGYKLRVSPGKKQLEIYRSDAVKKSVPLEWKPGTWTHLKLTLLQTGEKEWQVEGKIWGDGEKEPEKPSITFTDNEQPPAGRALISASPYSGTPIKFDDFVVSAIAP